MTCARTDFGLLTLLRLVSSWPDLQHLYTAGDTYGYPDEKTVASIPPPTCKIVSATFERFMSRFAQSSVLLAGSSESFKDLEMYALSHGAFLGFVKPVLGSIRSIKLGGNTGMTPDCIAALATQAPKLETLSLCGECDDDALKALADALNVEGSFPALRTIEYPAPREMHKTGRRRNVREHGHEDAYEDELRAAAGKRSISCWVGHALEYKVEGAQRRAGMAAMGRKYGGW
ncbi:hypothetical protein PUNSTDRAFT_120540 [Punctularia strigosozonata HHB-11173 SS5]|uniref:uncharacterized protein n=1 Tax=Punctularia strigosozonata (strain HHB-11173) TaxID=741275 RepID=UPI0004417EDD|nr:uncharacterized protein PUNSTDRAFT_120540 [Punctularia strigosozonata HHB-11173 SS5]EIN09134.1 hypothetical protein PUNSTDRAFT_120540 [Punctularia strigosozonata HHB-11173 SS5]